MRRSNAPTLQDVAREAGVTAMTVSVVLNGSRSATRVSDATRLRIQEAASRLRYRPNAVARGLSRRRMDTLGVAMTVDGKEVNLYFLELLNGILEQCAATEQNTTVFAVSDWDDESRILNFCDGRVDGVILLSPTITSEFAESLHERAPFITVHARQTLPNTVNLEVDSEAAAYQMVSYLIGLGHRRIMHLTGDKGRPGADSRVNGYRRALQDAGIPLDRDLLVECQYAQAAGRRCLTEFITEQRTAVLPTAIFCGNDAIAMGCMDVLAEYGIKVPGDVSVAGFDDSLLARMTTPMLTTVRQPLRAIGMRAVDLLLEIVRADDQPYTVINTLPTDTSRTELVDFEIEIRGTTAAPTANPVLLEALSPLK